MTSADALELEAMDGVDAFAADGLDDLEEDLAGESLEGEDDLLLDDDGLDEGLEAFEEEGDAWEDELGFDDGLAEEDLAAEECEACEAAVEDFDELGEFSYRPESGLYVPAEPRLVTGPAAIAMARQLNPFVLEQMSADDADEFFKSIGRAFRGIGRGISSAVSKVASAAPGILKAVGPVLSRALPVIQSVAGKLGPWGMLASAGLGAARGLIEGKGLGGALQGALGGLTSGIPGVGAILGKLGGAGGLAKGLGSILGGGGGGPLGGIMGALGGGGGGGPLGSIMGALGGGRGPLGNVLGALAPSGGAGGGLAGLLGGFLGGGDGADDDADLDALADMADARQIPAALALPIGAGLATRIVARKGCSRALQLPANRPHLWRRARAAERTLLAAGARAPGGAGQRLRVMRAIARLATYILRQRGGRPQHVTRAVRWAARRILALVRRSPTLGRVPAPIARRKLAARQRILRRVPMAALCRGTGRLAVAA